jgi:hypothetical protein
MDGITTAATTAMMAIATRISARLNPDLFFMAVMALVANGVLQELREF